MEVADKIRKAVPRLPRIGSALGRAFFDDPLFVWATQDDDWPQEGRPCSRCGGTRLWIGSDFGLGWVDAEPGDIGKTAADWWEPRAWQTSSGQPLAPHVKPPL
jgi:hypothetical protein